MDSEDNCEVSMDKQIHSNNQHAESGVSNEHRGKLGPFCLYRLLSYTLLVESTGKAAESSPFAAVLEVLARNKPILDVLSVTCLILIIASIGVVVCLAALYGKPPPKTNTGDNFTEDNFARIVTRNEWLAQPPKETLDLLQRPVQKVIIAHTATDGCTTKVNLFSCYVIG